MLSGIVEKEELVHIIINYLNTNSAPGHSSSSTPINDFENYAQSFDHIKQTCHNLFTSFSDKITSGNFFDDTLIVLLNLNFTKF